MIEENQFRSLFEIVIHHESYAGDCPDVEFIVPAATRRQLAARKMIAEGLFERFPVRIGRNQLNDLHIDRPYVSQFHAAIDIRDHHR